jgi:putative ABC transport system substrate-binding protein
VKPPAAFSAALSLGAIMAGAPLTAAAQQPRKVFRIGVLSPAERSSTKIFDAFREGLRDLGYIDGQNIRIEYRLAGGDTGRLQAMADELVQLPVDVTALDPRPRRRGHRVKRRELMLMLGGAMTAARALHAQQKTMPVVGFLGTSSPGPAAPNGAAFHQGLGETGYVEGQNLGIEYGWADYHYDRLPALAADLVGRKVDLIVAFGGIPAALAAKSATSTIPIVFSVGDPVESGLVASLARPSGNLTGVSTMAPELSPKRLELLSELVPRVGVIALLVNPNNSNTERIIGDMQKAARAKAVQLHILKAGTESEIDAAFATLVRQQAGALVVGGDPFFEGRREQFVALASRHGVPAIYQWREFAEAGGLISYGTSFTAVSRQLGVYGRKDSQGCQAGRPAGAAADQVRAGRQPQDR